jgi:acyl carrier protein
MKMQPQIDLDLFYNCFENALGVDKADLGMEKTLIDDLGADSLDLLDLIYQLEKAFNITISRGEIEKRARERLDGEAFEINGWLTRAGLQSLREELPEADLTQYLDTGLKINDIPQFFTVRTFYHLVMEQMRQEVRLECSR